MKKLLENKEFKITTPYKAGRTIVLKEDFQDEEFDSWEYIASPPAIVLKTNGNTVKLSWMKDSFSGPDFRGGQSVIHLEQFDIDKFRDELAKPKKVSMPHANQSVQLKQRKGELAVISNLYTGKDVYALKPSLFDVYDSLFQSGYKYAWYLSEPIEAKFGPLLMSICDADLADAAEMQDERGRDWVNFMIPLKTWPKVRKRLEKETNLVYNLDKAFKSLKLNKFRVPKDALDGKKDTSTTT